MRCYESNVCIKCYVLIPHQLQHFSSDKKVTHRGCMEAGPQACACNTLLPHSLGWFPGSVWLDGGDVPRGRRWRPGLSVWVSGGVGLHSVLGSGSSGLGSPGVPSPASASGGGWVPPPVLRPAAASLLSLVFPPLLALPGGYRGPLPLGSGVGVCGVPAGVVSAWSRTVPSVVLCWGGGGLRASLVWPERHGYSGVDVG